MFIFTLTLNFMLQISFLLTHSVFVVSSTVNPLYSAPCILIWYLQPVDSLLACKPCCWLEESRPRWGVGGWTWQPSKRLKSPPTNPSHTHSPFPQSTHTCASVWASFDCQSEPQEPQCCSAVWSNKIWGFFSHSGAAHRTYTCTNEMHTCIYIHMHS